LIFLRAGIKLSPALFICILCFNSKRFRKFKNLLQNNNKKFEKEQEKIKLEKLYCENAMQKNLR
jgi:hypothetical protein